jgi:predicted nucleotidyltransferase
MMIVPEERMQRAVEALRDFGARRVLLFGSFLADPENARDVDLAVEGIPLNRILAADVMLQEILEVPADLVSREENSEFFDFVASYGRILYEKG